MYEVSENMVVQPKFQFSLFAIVQMSRIPANLISKFSRIFPFDWKWAKIKLTAICASTVGKNTVYDLQTYPINWKWALKSGRKKQKEKLINNFFFFFTFRGKQKSG